MTASAPSSTSKHPRKKYTRRSEAQWRILIEDYAQSDLPLEAYCQHHQIAPSGFYSWRKRFENESTTESPTATLLDITSQLSDQEAVANDDATLLQVELTLGPNCILKIKTA